MGSGEPENWFFKNNFYPWGYGNPGESRQIVDRMGKLLIKCQGKKKALAGKGSSLILALIIKDNLIEPVIIAEGFKINLEANFSPWFDKQFQQNRFPSIFDRI